MWNGRGCESSYHNGRDIGHQEGGEREVTVIIQRACIMCDKVEVSKKSVDSQ